MKILQNESKQTGELYRTLVSSSPTAVYIAQEGKLVFVNPRFQSYINFPEDELLGVNPLDFVHPEDREQVRGNAVAMLKGTRSSPYEFRIMPRNRPIIWAVGTVSSVPYNGKRATLGNFIDITDRKEIEEALRESEEKYRSLFEEANDAIFLVDADTGFILDANREAELLLACPKNEIIGMHQSRWYPPDNFDYYTDKFRSNVEVGHKADFEADVIRNNGVAVQVHISTSVIQLQGKKVIQGIFRDITERKQMEQRLRELYQEERKLRQKVETEMARRVDFTRILVHELKTPLTPVLASSELLVTQLQDEPLLSLAKNINRGAANLNTRIDELLDLARGELGMLRLKPERLEPLPLLHGVVDDMSLVAKSRGLSLVLNVPPSLPPVWGDASRLRQVILNLLSNAAKFTPKGGHITLKAKGKDGFLIVEVQDTGPGIAEEEHQRLFEPYHRLESDRDSTTGLGLGLALCRTLVELHGGHIWVESRIGEGSTFGFSVPLEAANQQAKGTEAGGQS